MITAIFDTLMYAKKLREAGVPEKQAEIQAEALLEIMENNVATKSDLTELKKEFKMDLKELEYKLIIKMGAMFGLTIGVLAAIIKL